MKKEELKCAKKMLEFIEKSPSCFHAIENVRQILKENGYQEVSEKGAWELHPGQGYFVIRNDSSLIAFRVPDKEKKGTLPYAGFHIVASHSDSPSFKIKESPEILVEERYVKLNIEKYGGMILSTWLDRPLSVAGRIVVCEDGQLVTKLVHIDKDLLVIPNVAIHMNHEINKGMEYNPQVDMQPLFADGTVSRGRGALLKKVAKEAGVKEKDILAHDLFLYVHDKGRIFGENGEYVLSPRLDDLQCVYASVQAFVQAEPLDYINVCAVFDNEEIGSGTKQGADSTFLEDTLSRVAESLGIPESGGHGSSFQGNSLHGDSFQGNSFHESVYKRMLADSFLISADNAHAVHPNHPEKADPTNRPYLNGGVVIKYHGSQKYATDAVSAARMKALCKKAGVPYQNYANRADIPGGSTLGNISTAHVSVASVDIGLPQLAMHSAVETAGVKDTEDAVKVLQRFYDE